MYVGTTLPADRETLYYLTTKSIPAVDKDKLGGKNVLMLSTATRIKIFMRPGGLRPDPSEAPSKLTFSQRGITVTAKNPTPYYITLTQIKTGSQQLKNAVMVPPFGESHFTFPSANTGPLNYK